VKTLVAYYSLTGNVEEAAKKVAEVFSADLLKLEPVKEIPQNGFMMFMKGGFLASFGKGTKLKDYSSYNLEEYDRIILGTPVWASRPTPAVNEFIKKCGCKEKIYGVFTASGGGDNDKCLDILDKKLDNLKFAASLADKKNPEVAQFNDEVLQEFIDNLR